MVGINKKAGSSSNIIMWIGIIIALIIVIIGVVGKLNPTHIKYEKINIDLKKISKKIDDSSNAYYYQMKYNPLTEKGTLEIHKNKICINETIYMCNEILTELKEENISLENITYVIIERTEGSSKTKISFD